MRNICVRACPFLLILVAAVSFAQDAVITRKGTKAPAGYKTYSLFLIPSSDWEAKDRDLRGLRTAFQAFGEAIGNQKAALWFSNEDDTRPDFIRSKDYCDQFGLNYNDGPYVVTLKSLPEAVKRGDPVIVVKLNGISSDRVVSILNILEQDVRTDKNIREGQLLFEEIKQRLLTVKDRHGSELKDIATLLLKVK
jgi:hypothetical protein